MEVLSSYQLNIPVLKISQYPLPEQKIKEFTNRFNKVMIAEEGYPIYEELLRGFFDNQKFTGRLDGTLPRVGELSPDAIYNAIFNKPKFTMAVPEVVANRPPELCQGCSHRDLFDALNTVMATYDHKHVFGDIGCYTLGALPPYSAINTCVDMGASVTMAKGAADAGLHPAVAVIGDSTFTHSGITGLLDAVNDKTKMTLIISDNYTTAMTGGQESSGTNKLQQICEGIGVKKEHIHTIVPLKKNLEENIETMKQAFEYEGVSVIIACRECIQTLRRKSAKK